MSNRRSRQVTTGQVAELLTQDNARAVTRELLDVFLGTPFPPQPMRLDVGVTHQVTTGQVAALLVQSKRGEITRESLQEFLRDPGALRDRVPVGAFRFQQVLPTMGPSFTFPVVNYGLTVEQMIASGGYDDSDSEITQGHFPHNQLLSEVPVNAEYVDYGLNIGCDEAIHDLEARAMRPATMAELLAFGAAFPDEQLNGPIVGLGSIYRRYRGWREFGCLDSGEDNKRVVRLLNMANCLAKGSRVLAVRTHPK